MRLVRERCSVLDRIRSCISDHEFVLKKLELTEAEFAELMSRPPRPHTDFAAEQSVYDAYPMLRPFRGAAEILKSAIPDSRR